MEKLNPKLKMNFSRRPPVQPTFPMLQKLQEIDTFSIEKKDFKEDSVFRKEVGKKLTQGELMSMLKAK